MEKVGSIEQIEMNLEQVYQDVQELKNNEEIKPVKIGVPVRVNLIEHELHLISKVQSLLADCGDFRSCSRADALRLALDLLDLSCPNGILDSFNNIKKYDRRTGSKKCIDK